MKVANIVPMHHLDLVRHQAYHLIVAPWLKDMDHIWTVQRWQTQGHYIIIDNGEVEFALSNEIEERPNFEKVVETANLVCADEICMPDVLYDADETITRHKEYANLVEPRRRMVIPQGDSLEEWFDCLSRMVRMFNFATIGIPKHLERFLVGGIEGRHHLCGQIEKEGWHKLYDVHLLGVWDSPRGEIQPIARDFPWVRGIDTGVACAYAQLDESGWDIKDYYGKHVGLDQDPTRKMNTRVAIANMEVLNEWAYSRR